MDVDEEQEPQLLNYRLYRNFWKVQQYFADPHESLKSVEDWKTMLQSLEDVLETFENVNLSNRKVQRVQNQCSKYLTKRSLLRLQVNDPVMRRNVLLQVLFMLQYLSTCSIRVCVTRISLEHQHSNTNTRTLNRYGERLQDRTRVAKR